MQYPEVIEKLKTTLSKEVNRKFSYNDIKVTKYYEDKIGDYICFGVEVDYCSPYYPVVFKVKDDNICKAYSYTPGNGKINIGANIINLNVLIEKEIFSICHKCIAQAGLELYNFADLLVEIDCPYEPEFEDYKRNEIYSLPDNCIEHLMYGFNAYYYAWFLLRNDEKSQFPDKCCYFIWDYYDLYEISSRVVNHLNGKHSFDVNKIKDDYNKFRKEYAVSQFKNIDGSVNIGDLIHCDGSYFILLSMSSDGNLSLVGTISKTHSISTKHKMFYIPREEVFKADSLKIIYEYILKKSKLTQQFMFGR